MFLCGCDGNSFYFFFNTTTMKSQQTLDDAQGINLFLLEKFLTKHQLQPKDIGDYIPSFFHFNNPDLTIDYLNNNGCEWIGHSSEEINEMGYEFFEKYIHPVTLEVVFPRFLQFYQEKNTTKIICDFQRILDPRTKKYKTCLTVSKVCDDLSGLLTITQPIEDISTHNKKLLRILDEDSFIRQNFSRFQSLTPREREILTLILKGDNNPAIADQLFISRRTVEQHRKNINRKLEINSCADLYRFGYAFDLV